MHLQFGQPIFLLLALPLIAHALWMARRLKLLSPPRRILSATLRILLILLCVAALSGARLTRESKDLTVFYLLDNSDSIPETQHQLANTYLKKNMLEMGTHDRSGIIVFGANSAVEQGPTNQADFDHPQSVINSKGTNVADAIQLAMACFIGESQKRIVILSDGNQTAGDAEVAARSAAASKIAIDVLPLKYENRNDVIVEKAIVENRVSLDEPFDIKVIVTSRQSTNAKLTIQQDGKLVGNVDVHLDADKKNVFTIPTSVKDSGFHTFYVQVHAEGDLIPENNQAYAFTFGQGEPRVLLVDGDSNPSKVLPSMLLSEKIKVEVTDPGGIPQSLRDLQNYDALIFNNVAASDLTATQMKMIETAVHDLGLGFIMIGGENSFGAGGYNDTPVERILPVDMEMKNEKVLPQGALVPIVHTCEIPDGNYWAAQIVHAALDVLSPRDLMGVLFFDWSGGDKWLFPLQEVGDKAALHKIINGLSPCDMPSFDTMLGMAYTSLSTCTASVKHIIVISDGDPQTPNQALATKIKQANITISTICINPHSPRDVDSLKTLAKWGGGNFYQPNKSDRLPQIFIKEAATVRKSLIFEEPFTPAAKSYSPLLPGIGDAYPILKGYVGTTPKGLADVPLVTDKGDPLLANWQHGVGKTVAFTSDAKERWAVNWLTWEKYSKFWAQSVRWCLCTPFNQNYQVETSVDGSQGKITIDAVNSKGEFRNFLDFQGRVVSPSLQPIDVTFRQTSPGRYEAHFDAQEPGTYMFSALSGAESGPTKDLVTGGTSLSYSPEYQTPKSNEVLLYRLVDTTHGRVLDEKSPVYLHNLPSSAEPTVLWPLLLTIALFLFLFDVFTRRVLIGWKEIAAGNAVAWNWIRERYGWRRVTVGGETSTGKLLKVKENVRSGDSQTGQQREDFLASLKQVKSDKSPVAEALKKSEPKPEDPTKPKSGPSKPAAAGDDGSPMQQLMRARQQARKRFDKER